MTTNNIFNKDNVINVGDSNGGGDNDRTQVLSQIKGGNDTLWVMLEPKQIVLSSNGNLMNEIVIQPFLHYPDSPCYQLLFELDGQFIHINTSMFDGDLCTSVETYYKSENKLITMHSWPIKGPRNKDQLNPESENDDEK